MTCLVGNGGRQLRFTALFAFAFHCDLRFCSSAIRPLNHSWVKRCAGIRLRRRHSRGKFIVITICDQGSKSFLDGCAMISSIDGGFVNKSGSAAFNYVARGQGRLRMAIQSPRAAFDQPNPVATESKRGKECDSFRHTGRHTQSKRTFQSSQLSLG